MGTAHNYCPSNCHLTHVRPCRVHRTNTDHHSMTGCPASMSCELTFRGKPPSSGGSPAPTVWSPGDSLLRLFSRSCKTSTKRGNLSTTLFGGSDGTAPVTLAATSAQLHRTVRLRPPQRSLAASVVSNLRVSPPKNETFSMPKHLPHIPFLQLPLRRVPQVCRDLETVLMRKKQMRSKASAHFRAVGDV